MPREYKHAYKYQTPENERKTKIIKATIPCQKCEKDFKSVDTTLNRICPKCNINNQQIHSTGDFG